MAAAAERYFKELSHFFVLGISSNLCLFSGRCKIYNIFFVIFLSHIISHEENPQQCKIFNFYHTLLSKNHAPTQAEDFNIQKIVL